MICNNSFLYENNYSLNINDYDIIKKIKLLL